MPASKSKLRVVIPARYGSSRLPGKPLIDLAGKPMVVRVYDAVRAALIDADIVVAVDDQRILTVLEAYGAPAVMTDPGHESGTDRTAEVARAQGWAVDDVILNVQGDEPLVPSNLLRAFAAFCTGRAPFSIGTIAAPVSSQGQISDPNVVKVILDAEGRAISFSRASIPFARDYPEGGWPLDAYLRHVGVYGYRNDVLQRLTQTPPCALEQVEKLEQLRALWLGIAVQVMWWPKSPPHGVDTAEDALRAAELIKGTEL